RCPPSRRRRSPAHPRHRRRRRRARCHRRAGPGGRPKPYQRPTFSESGEMRILAGRHPVIECLAAQEAGRFIPNDLYLNDSTGLIAIITGPNMGGKSTYLRQAALIAILAQLGPFVPAESASLPIFDRLLTRLGPSA